MTSNTSSGASVIAGRPGIRASAIPAMTRTIDGAVRSRRAIAAAATSTTRRERSVRIVAVIRNLDRACRDIDCQRQQSGVEDEGNHAVTERGPADGLAAYRHVGHLCAHSDGE